MNECPFCNFKKDDSKFENHLCLYIEHQSLDVLVGSGIIIPKSHKESVFDLSIQEWNASYELLGIVKAYIDEVYKPEGYNVGWNIGAVGGQEVFHAHMHIIPRYKDEPLTGKGIRYWLKQSINKRGK